MTWQVKSQTVQAWRYKGATLEGKPEGGSNSDSAWPDAQNGNAGATWMAAVAFAAAALAAGGFPLVGSVATLCTGAAGLVAFFLVLSGRLPLFRHPAIRLLSAVVLAYVGAGFISYVLHPRDEANLEQALMRCAFLWFLPLASLFAVLPARKLLEAIETGAAAGAIATLVYVGFEIFILHRVRAWGGAGNPGPFATVLAVQFGLCILALFRESRSNRVLFAAGAAAAVLCILASGMRTVLPVLLLVPAFEALNLWRRGTGSNLAAKPVLDTRRLIAFAAVLLLAVIAVAASGRFWNLQAEFAQAMQGDLAGNSLGHRWAIWQFAMERFPGNWLAGMGQDAAVEDLQTYAASRFGLGLHTTHLHNILLTALFRGGIVDFAATLVFLFSPLLVLARYRVCNGEGMRVFIYVWLVYFLMAMTNLAFGHDILDHHFIAMLAAASAIAFRPFRQTEDGEMASRE